MVGAGKRAAAFLLLPSLCLFAATTCQPLPPLLPMHGIRPLLCAQALETQIALIECEDETGKAKMEQLMVSATELAELVGARSAVLLLRAHGARDVRTDTLEPSSAPAAMTAPARPQLAVRSVDKGASFDA